MKLESDFTLYNYVYNDLRKKIAAGILPEGSKLPSVVQLCGIYHTSDATIRKSLEMLKAEHCIYSIKRVGLFVSDLQRTALHFEFHENTSLKSVADRCEILQIIEENAEIKNEHGKQKHLRIKRLYAKGVLPVYLKINYLPIHARRTHYDNTWLDEMDYILNSRFIKKKVTFAINNDEAIKKLLFIPPGMAMYKIDFSFFTEEERLESTEEIYCLSSDLDLQMN